MTFISDHAVLRYLERAYGLDIEKIRAEIASPIVVLADGIGCGTVVGKNGVRITIVDGTVVTVLPKRRRR